MPLHIEAYSLWWIAAGGASYGARYMTHRWRSARLPHIFTDGWQDELLSLQQTYGYNAHSLVSVTPGARLWRSQDLAGAIIYSDFGRVRLAAGDPLTSVEETSELARRFIVAARQEKRIAAFVPASARFARTCAAACDLSGVKVGAAPYFDLQTWGPRGDRAKKLRAGINQARRAGVTIEALATINPLIVEETATLCRNWLRTRRTATTFGWLFALDPFRHGERKKFFAARDADGKLVGFLAASPIPAREGWYLEDVLREPCAPNGTADLLVSEALLQLGASGAKLATLGTSPLAMDGGDDIPKGDHAMVERALRLTSKRLGMFYNFEGLRRFKAKFAPTWWESEYVLVPRGATVPPRVAHAIVRAIAPGGVSRLLTRHVARSIRRKESAH
jgi:phosphatidylglycerol lysyltransferase